MAKTSKEFELRMQGMIAAQNIVKQGGIEALEKDIKYRGLTKAPVTVTSKEVEDFLEEISENLFVTVKTVSLMALKDLWGFGNKRLRQFEEKFQKLTEDACDISWIGRHYVTLTDYAECIQEENGIKIETDITDRCQRSNDKSNPLYKRVELDRLIFRLTENGFEDAADYILKTFAGK